MSALVRCGEQSMESNKDFFVTANTLNEPSNHMLTTPLTGKQTCYAEFWLCLVSIYTMKNCIKLWPIVRATLVFGSPKGIKNHNTKRKGSVLQNEYFCIIMWISRKEKKCLVICSIALQSSDKTSTKYYFNLL